MQYFWNNNGWELTDKHLSGLKNMPFERPMPFYPEKPGAYLIRGPRQIGKTSWLKSILSRTCRSGKKAFYFSCENLADYKDLAEILLAARDADVVLIDEISFVSEWWRAVKHELDRGTIPILVITGSNSVDLRKGMDQMPGRWGGGGESLLLPMEFSEFQSMRRLAGWPQLTLHEELKMYFRVGGFPNALAESGPTGSINPVQAMTTYRQWLLGDILKLGKHEIYLKEMLLQIARTTTSTVSLQSLAQKTQMGSHHTAQDYIQVLEDCFALKTLYAFDPEKEGFRFRKEKKFYLRDPIIYWLAFEWAGAKPPENCWEQLAESVAHEHILRRSKRFGYFNSSKGEIDFIGASGWAIEVKWQPIVDGLSRVYKDFKCQEKIVWSQRNLLQEWPQTLLQESTNQRF